MKRLYRSRHDQMLAGVAAGMAEHLDVDPTLMRLLWVLAGFAGFGVLGYIIAAIIIPLEPGGPVTTPGGPSTAAHPEPDAAPVKDDSAPVPSRGRTESVSGNRLIGWLFVIFGAMFFINQIMPRWAWGRLWPVALIGLGVYLLIDRGRSA